MNCYKNFKNKRHESEREAVKSFLLLFSAVPQTMLPKPLFLLWHCRMMK